MRAITAILGSALTGTILLQIYFAVWNPSSFGRFAEFPVLLIYSLGIVTATFLLFIMPGFHWLRQARRRVAWPVGFAVGLMLGCLIMGLFISLFFPPITLAELFAGGMSGAVGMTIYAKLIFR